LGNRGKKANKLGAEEQGFLNHPVHKLVCIAGVVEQGAEGTMGRGDLKSGNAGVPVLGVTSENACSQQLRAEWQFPSGS
jgi:hypothetical protein